MRIILGLITLVFLVSCSEVKKPPKPDNLISKKEMINIILDVSLIRASEGSYKTKLKQEGFSIESYVYKRHDIDSAQFAMSNEYYSYDLDTYQDIYKKVEDSLNLLKTYYEEKRDSLTEERKKKRDSIPKGKRKPPSRRERELNKIKKDSLIVKKDSLILPKVH